MSDTPPNPLEGLLSEFALGPSWARAKSDSPKPTFKDSPEREYQPRRGDDRRDGGGRGRSDNRGDSRGRDDRRQGGGGGNRRDFGKGNFRDRNEPRREEIPPAEGVNVTLIPDKTAIQLIAKEVHQVARVYPLFDIAEIILAERSRSRAIFEIDPKQPPFYRCKIDEAIFLTKEEAVRHLLAADWSNRYIEQSTFEVEPPKGNFQSVAKCGISGEWLGPPNYHAYQTEIRRIHRERFANMPFEAYAAKVRTERSEEAVNEWLESMKNQTRWRILSEEETAAVAADSIRPAESEMPPSPPEQPSPEEPFAVAEAETIEAPEGETPAAEEEPSIAAEEETAEAPVEETPVSEEEAPVTDEEETTEAPAEAPHATEEKTWFTDRAEFERALSTDLVEKIFHVTRKAKVSAAIPGKNLSPGLLVRLKGTGNHHKKHPAILIPAVCKILEAEHMPVFKRKGKLFTGPARPHALAADAVLAPRPAQMVTWIRENTPAKLEGLWNAVLPEGATAPPAEFAADLFWLLQQGHILLYTDDTLVVQEQPKPQEPKKPKQSKKKASLALPTDTLESPTDTLESPTGTLEPSTDTLEPSTDTLEPSTGTLEPSTDTLEPSTQEPEPVEIITEALKDVAGTITEAASKLIDSIAADAAPETPTPAPESPENPDQKPLP